VLTHNWHPERQRLVKAELASQLQAYWENRFEFDLKPVPGRPGDWGVFFKVARPASPASRLLVTGLRQGNRFTSTEGHSVALVATKPPPRRPKRGRRPTRPPGRPRNVHGWGATFNHACEEHAHFLPTGGWTGGLWTQVANGAPGEEATVFYSPEEDIPCTLCTLSSEEGQVGGTQ